MYLKNRNRSALIMAICLLILTGCISDEVNSNLAGIWSCTETSEIFLKGAKGTVVFDVTFTRDAANQDQYYIGNIYQLGSDIKASILVSGTVISLTEQTTIDGFKIKGSGTIDDTYTIIHMIYTVDDGGGTVDHLTAEFAR